MDPLAVIDIGSNSVKFYLCKKNVDGNIQTLADKNNITRLGENLLKTGRIGEAALERNARAVAEFAAEARKNGAGNITAVGTMALRSAGNSEAFIRRTKELADVDVKIISGEEEARLSYLAVLSGMAVPEGETVVFDTGGGSTEFIFGEKGQVSKRFSVNLGALRITEKYFNDDPVREGSVEEALNEIDEEFAKACVAGHPAAVIGIGGAVTGMGAVKYRMEQYRSGSLQGTVLGREDIEEQIAAYRRMTIAQRRQIPGLQPKRADIILAGACILKTVIRRLNVNQLTISVKGLRHGLAYELLG